VRHSRHSSAAGRAATRGGFTRRRRRGGQAGCANSSTPGASGAELRFIASRRAMVTSEQVNSPVASMLRRLSLRPADENITIGGRSLTPLKKL
jgi:hypothetical protein